jgi:hypothetical protein
VGLVGFAGRPASRVAPAAAVVGGELSAPAEVVVAASPRAMPMLALTNISRPPRAKGSRTPATVRLERAAEHLREVMGIVVVVILHLVYSLVVAITDS